MIPTLYDDQLDFVERIRKVAREGAKRIVCQAATGAGKTTCFSSITKDAAAKDSSVLNIVHRRRLVDQISDTLIEFQVDHGVLMAGHQREHNARVQVVSKDTLMSRCVKNGWIGMPPADLVNVDEAHHAADDESEYRRILDRYPNSRVLLWTATPVDKDGKGMGPWAQAIVCAKPTSQLVAMGRLVPVKVYAPDRKMKGSKVRRGLTGDVVESWKQYGENRPTVVFFSRVQHSLDAVEKFKEAGIPAVHMDANTPDEPDETGMSERDRILELVGKGEIKILCNVSIVGEGVDVPELGCCVIACNMGSRIRFLQAVGRIMRVFAGKKYGILIDHAGAVFEHGFPDEDTDWPLDGNANEVFQGKHDLNLTEAALYCKKCEIVYHGSKCCPECGRMPVKPPRSVFAPPLDYTDEMLTEAERGQAAREWSEDAKIKTWWACLFTSVKRNGNFKMASAMYHKKYGEWPGDHFPCLPNWNLRGTRIKELYPNIGKKKAQ